MCYVCDLDRHVQLSRKVVSLCAVRGKRESSVSLSPHLRCAWSLAAVMCQVDQDEALSFSFALWSISEVDGVSCVIGFVFLTCLYCLDRG